MSVISATVGRPAPLATPAMLRASSRAPSSVGMKAPEPVLTSMTSALQPRREFLRQDRGGDQRDRLDRRGDVANGVEAPVGGREIGGLADDRAARLARRRGETARDRAARHSRESNRACRACRRYGRGRDPRSSGHRRRRPPASAPASGETLSPTPPVECLSTTGPGRSAARQSSVTPERVIARVRCTRSSKFMPRKNTAMANAAACPSVTAPDVRPAMKAAMSSSLSASPSRLARMISCGSIRRPRGSSSCAAMKARSRRRNCCEPSVGEFLRLLMAGIAAREARRRNWSPAKRRRSAGRSSARSALRGPSTCPRDRRREFSPRGFRPASRSSGRKTTCRRPRAARRRPRAAACFSVASNSRS